MNNVVPNSAGNVKRPRALADEVARRVETAMRETKPAARPPDEVGWLIERRDRQQPYWFFYDERGNFGWTPDANKALRFARKVDGDNFCADWIEDVFVCEHMWVVP